MRERCARPALDQNGELVLVEACARVLRGDHDEAIGLLQRAKARDPGAFAVGTNPGWWWNDLRDHPKFTSVFGQR